MASHFNAGVVLSALIPTIMRTFRSREEAPMKALLKSLIIPKLDYCSPLINPKSETYKRKMETPLRAFTRKIRGMKELTYWERLQKLNMYSIERRRERFCIIYMYKIMTGMVPNPNIKFYNKGRRGTEREGLTEGRR